ncbi:hypothetical protein OIU84_018451 [Salix udensis]|uniref:CNNM transmembrane domain-containing protein n=1 Tax=Salix udensis TaxID=889485 RepID=A0AAD6PJ33_9ROSI|nr:hypothetical protein OIU84_018451 [Salix udensis]
MQLLNAVMATRMLSVSVGQSNGDEIPYGSVSWFVYAGISCFLVLFAGIMSGLTLGLMSLGLVDLEILQRSGTSSEKKQAAAILPVVKKQHQLLVTLLLCNAASMEALPIYLDKLFNQYLAIILSVTFVLAFGEVIPQAICTRYGLAVGANFVWLVRILMIICYPISYPIGKVLDCVLGHNEALFRRAQLKALVSIHGQEAGKGGELTHDETTIISGALDLTEKVYHLKSACIFFPLFSHSSTVKILILVILFCNNHHGWYIFVFSFGYILTIQMSEHVLVRQMRSLLWREGVCVFSSHLPFAFSS